MRRTRQQVRELRQQLREAEASGMSRKAIALDYGLSLPLLCYHLNKVFHNEQFIEPKVVDNHASA